MRDIWSFLLQTLTASGVAALLLLVKALFRDKLSPRWQFAVWGILGIVLLLPAGLWGRYVLFNWPLAVEALRSALTGEFGTLTRVLAPIPLPSFAPPETVWDWLYLVYVAGGVLLMARYIISYIRLRLALKRGRPVQDGRIEDAAAKYGLPVCPAVEVDGLPSAFVCGVFRPVLALPAGGETDEKVILHELLHLKYHDAAWGLAICLFRCLHWCDPLLWWCADLVANDLESLCDQRVLERLEGEERRDYGRILLEMADEKYACAPGTSSVANGGKNIRRRIEAIARFKRYPAGMTLVSVCVALVLACPLIVGARAEAFDERDMSGGVLAMARARMTWCTTYAGAFDTYAKAMLTGSVPYRAMCAPLAEQDELAAGLKSNDSSWLWDRAGGENTWPDAQAGYRIYGLAPAGDGWEGLLVMKLNYPPEGMSNGENDYAWAAVQKLRAEEEGERWVIVPQEELWTVQAYGWSDIPSLTFTELPAWVYEAETEDFIIQMRRQNTARVPSEVTSSSGLFSSTSFDTTPRPDGEFTMGSGFELNAIYTGDPADAAKYTHIAATAIPLWEVQERPKLDAPGLVDGGGSATGGSTDGANWGGQPLNDGDLEPGGTIFLSGGGSSGVSTEHFPPAYAVDLYLNGELAAELTLLPTDKGGMDFD